jgi:hypothetical protein
LFRPRQRRSRIRLVARQSGLAQVLGVIFIGDTARNLDAILWSAPCNQFQSVAVPACAVLHVRRRGFNPADASVLHSCSVSGAAANCGSCARSTSAKPLSINLLVKSISLTVTVTWIAPARNLARHARCRSSAVPPMRGPYCMSKSRDVTV